MYFKSKKLSTLVGDEGGYSPALTSNEEVFESITAAATQAHHELVRDFTFAVDSAATEFYEDGQYVFKKTNEKKYAIEEEKRKHEVFIFMASVIESTYKNKSYD